ncbi:MAG TPA: transposase [Vicinamibacterales bacterium]|nr:transposase [Vicinamibacterales bacterium]
MARRSRIQFPGAVYHVMSRGNRKSTIVDDNDDRRTFMTTFSEAANDCQVRVYACCLMGTHYHTLLDTPRGNLSEFIRTLNTEYSKAFNRRHGRVGHTFEQRFESLVVQREKYLRRVARYIALNPVKAHLCRDAADWPWSTHRATAGLEDAPAWLHLDWLRWAFRADQLFEAQRHYHAYVKDPAGLTWSFDLAAALGTARFKKAVAESLAQGGKNRPIPFDCRRCAQPPLESVFTGEEADRRSRDALILVARMTHGYRLAEIARFLTVSPSTVSKALSRARDRKSPDGHDATGFSPQ